jgi:multiple sugar transport system permease protein
MRNKKLVNYAKYGYLFSIPFILAFALFTLYPVIYTFIIGFTDLKGAGNTEWHFLPTVGKNLFTNFKDVLTSGTFQKAFKNTWIIWILNFIPQIGFALLFTAWFTDRRSKVKGQGLFKILFYMPNIITAATLAILFNVVYRSSLRRFRDSITACHVSIMQYLWMGGESNTSGVSLALSFCHCASTQNSHTFHP